MKLDFLKKITGGLFLLTTEFNGIKNGCIINNCMEVSTNPSCISISVMKNSYTNELIEKSKKFAISILNKDVSSEMVKKFELFSGRKNDKFQNISTVMDKNNVPYVTKNVSTVISANVISKFDLGTHTLFIAQVIDINDINNSKPITYDEYQKNVVLKEKNKASSQHIVGWKCRRCGYVHIGEILPNNFICPLCGRGKGDFDPIFKEEIEN